MRIYIYADDHNPPHFHVATPDHDALIRISDLEVLQGQITRKTLDLVRAWAADEENLRSLRATWERLNER